MNAVVDAGPPPPVSDRSTFSRRIRDWRSSRLLIAAALVALAIAAVISAARVDSDGDEDLLHIGTAIATTVVRLRWQFGGLVVAFAALHYLATAIAARASAGRHLPLGETVLVQLAAAAANRITPMGLGGSAITARYFVRRGLDTAAAVCAVAALNTLGAAADLAVFVTLIVAGRRLGLAGGSHQLSIITTKLTQLLSVVNSPWLWGGLALVTLGVADVLVVARKRTAGAGTLRRKLRDAATRGWVPVRSLLHRPRALLTLVLASGSTTLLLGFAFAACCWMLPGPHPHAGLGAVLVAFMIGAGAGALLPIPAGLGTTEAALTSVLVGLRVPAADAVRDVLTFRLLTFWTPAAIGVLATRRLYRQRAL